MKDKHDKKTIDMLKTTKTGAERQKAYRARVKEQQGKRIDFQATAELFSKLDTISLYGNESKKEVLQRLIEAEFKRVVNLPDFDINKLQEKS